MSDQIIIEKTTAYLFTADILAICPSLSLFRNEGCQDRHSLMDVFEETRMLYAFHFGQKIAEGFSICRTGCKPVKCR